MLCMLMVVSLQSCVMKEEIHVNRKGNIDYSFNLDFSELMKFSPDAKDSMQKDMGKALDFFNGKELTIEQYLDLALAKEENGQEKKDSLLAEHPDLFKNLDNVLIKFVMNDSVGDVNFRIDAEDSDQLNKTFAQLEELSKVTKDKENPSKDAMDFNSVVSEKTYYESSKKVFERKVKEVDTAEMKKTNMGGMDKMFTYIVKVSFDRKIKSVSYPDAVISADGKSFTKEFKVGDIMEDPTILGYKVKLK